jgi:hypothetical protein
MNCLGVPRRRCLLGVTALGIGLATLITGAWLETRNPRSNVEDTIAWWVLAAGMFLLGVGVSLPFARPIISVLIGIVFPLVGWWLLLSVYPLGLHHSRWPTQEQMVPSGYRMIPEATQVDDLLGPAWHRLSNYQEPDSAEWQTEALFAGRYELSMRVRVRVDRSSGRVTEVVGEPRFLLLEIKEIRDSREVRYNGNHQREFGVDQWHQVVRAKGDFSVIGIQLDRSNPVFGFDRYKAVTRTGIQMRSEDNAAPIR